MNDSADADRDEPGPPRAHWPLDLMKSLAAERPHFVRPRGLGGPGGEKFAALLLTASPREAQALGQALVGGLQPADFVGTTGDGDDAQDRYAATYAGQRLRVGLGPYRFSGQPPILMIEITALPDEAAAAAKARR